MISRFRLALVLAVILSQPYYAGQCAPNSGRLDSLIEPPPPLPTQTPALRPAPTSISTSAKAVTAGSRVAHELRRLDFRIEGKSCAVCLIGIQNKLKSYPGVQDVAVMIKRPYGASVVYETGKTNLQTIISMLKEKDPTIKILEIKDDKVSSIPVPLIPPFILAPESEKGNNENARSAE